MDTKTVTQKGMGWHRGVPDFRDYTPEHEKIKPLLKKLNMTSAAAPRASLAAKIDLRMWCSAIEDQQDLGSCTAQAGAGLIEFYENKAYGTHIDASRLFLYKVTRNLLGWTGDTGAYLSTTMAAMTLFGAPPEKYWVYTTARPESVTPPAVHFNTEPPAFCYAFGQNYQSINYYRLDPAGVTPSNLLQRIKTHLAGNMPSMFGFTVYSSYKLTETEGYFPFPCPKEKVEGGHAVVAVGYDDAKKIKNPICGKETSGALLIRNSWGPEWGEKGYGWLPYEYVLQGQADDFWALLKNEYVDTKKFGL